ncbi:hypothetical protein M9Y10_008604 [Tritrichomonas musculus]|uniref:Copine family protein n=1 Tax=Tritrichomonas musculus TaxID=1915356 RepID=A0ABR2IYK1_9EUKA
MKVAYSSYNNIPFQQKNDGIANYTGTESVNTNILSTINRTTTFPLVNLHVSAKKLKNVDIVTVSDPICVLFTFDTSKQKWVEFGRTEVIWNNLNPEWVTFFTVMYVFEIKQPLKFSVYDIDDNKKDLKKQKLIGEAEIELANIISAEKASQIDLFLPKSGENCGQLIITPEQVENCSSMVNFQIEGGKFKKIRAVGSPKPFYIIAKSTESGAYIPIYQSEVDKKMKWNEVTIPYQILCNIDSERPLRITIYDHKDHKSAHMVGYADTSFTHLSEGVNSPVDIINSKNKKVGTITVTKMSLDQRYNFYDYIHGGIQLNLITAIDFTASNRDPRNPSSLHYFAPSGDSMNQYQSCIRSVGEILCPYDSDQLFPVLGFGAKIAGVVQHCFPLTFNPQAPCVRGLDGILGAYQNALMQVQLSGPTLFAPTIRYASQLAVESFRESRTYTILLIITDGIINDMQDTADAIVDASALPISIIIVGVGNADFTAMNVLDADDEPLESRNGTKESRDLVQFVPFNKFAKMHYSVLATQVLDEVPRQLCEWAEMNNVKPYLM